MSLLLTGRIKRKVFLGLFLCHKQFRLVDPCWLLIVPDALSLTLGGCARAKHLPFDTFRGRRLTRDPFSRKSTRIRSRRARARPCFTKVAFDGLFFRMGRTGNFSSTDSKFPARGKEGNKRRKRTREREKKSISLALSQRNASAFVRPPGHSATIGIDCAVCALNETCRPSWINKVIRPICSRVKEHSLSLSLYPPPRVRGVGGAQER